MNFSRRFRIFAGTRARAWSSSESFEILQVERVVIRLAHAAAPVPIRCAIKPMTRSHITAPRLSM